MGWTGSGSKGLAACGGSTFSPTAKMLGRQDSNLGSRDQNPLPYHLATAHCGGRSLASGGEEEHQGESGEDADRDQRERPDHDREDRDEHDESLRDGGDPGDVSDRSRPKSMSEPQEDDNHSDRDRERHQPRDRVDDQEEAFDDRDPDRDRDSTFAQPAA